jgi:hypothetical protein
MAKMPKQVMDLINDPESVKFLATVDAEGKPNCTLYRFAHGTERGYPYIRRPVDEQNQKELD